MTKKDILTFLLALVHLELIWIYILKAVQKCLFQSAKIPLYTNAAFDPKGKEPASAQASSNIYRHVFHFDIHLDFTFISNKIPTSPLLAKSDEIWNGREGTRDKRQSGREFWFHVEGWAEAKYFWNKYYLPVFFNGKRKGFFSSFEDKQELGPSDRSIHLLLSKNSCLSERNHSPKKSQIPDKTSILQSYVPICIQTRCLTLYFYSATDRKFA